MESQHERNVPPWYLEEPHWVADAEATQCANAQCNAKFTFVKRKVRSYVLICVAK